MRLLQEDQLRWVAGGGYYDSNNVYHDDYDDPSDPSNPDNWGGGNGGGSGEGDDDITTITITGHHDDGGDDYGYDFSNFWDNYDYNDWWDFDNQDWDTSTDNHYQGPPPPTHVNDTTASHAFNKDFSDMNVVNLSLPNGKTVAVELDNKTLTPDQQAQAMDKVAAAYDNIAAHWNELTPQQQRDINNINEIVVTTQFQYRSGTDEPHGIFGIQFGELMAPGSDTPWISSIIQHDGHHVSQYQDAGNSFSGSRTPGAELDANQAQIAAGAALGLSAVEIANVQYMIDHPEAEEARRNLPM